MASPASVVYLGYSDDQVNSKNLHLVNFSVSKIGGLPNWCTTGCNAPTCVRCRRKLLLVMQLYAPLEGSCYHRTLYVFSCITPECWNRPNSWVCIRRQVLEYKSTVSASGSVTSDDAEFDGWFEEKNQWGEGSEDEDNGNSCIHPTTNMFLQYMAVKKQSHLKQHEDNSTENLNQIKITSSSQTVSEVTNFMENKLNLNEGDSNANEALCGAVGMQGNVMEGMEATAIIEGPEGDVISVETPDQLATDIPALFKEVSHIDTSADVSFTSYFITTCIEPAECTGLSEHESELLLRYTQTTGHEFRDEDICGTMDAKGDGTYEKTVAHHGDIFMHKFKKRVLRSPQQIVRYCRDEWAFPLWIHSPVKTDLPKVCSHCGGKLTFEAQIMPQLIPLLKLANMTSIHSSVLEFGTVILYTCLASCWRDGDSVRQEYVVVQGEED